jgi:hypothetical protein
MATCSANALLNASKQFAGLDNKSLYVTFAQLLCNWLKLLDPTAVCDAKSILQAACESQINCLNNRDIFIVTAQLLCEILQAGGGSTSSCLLCGTVDPVDAPACECALYYKRTPDGNGEFWYWDVDTVAWVKFLGGAA